jgi:hypothetical protein
MPPDFFTSSFPPFNTHTWKNLLAKAYEIADLTEREKFVFGLVYGLLEDRPFDIPEVATWLKDYFGVVQNDLQVSAILEKGELKVFNTVWKIIGDVLDDYFGSI